MAMFYSSSTGGFYNPIIHDDLPEDCIEITDEEYQGLLEGQAGGGTISACAETGAPEVLTPTIDPATVRTKLIASVKREASRRILNISPEWRQLNDLRAPSDEANERFAAIDAVRAASNAIEAQIGDTSDDILPAFDIASDTLWPA
ncbi:hypothetical protein WBP07_12750 [Novosphingobium sp. BL-8A]|uniref:hypothetical protein n=1 Tax=Novosphingobium sp. BL-8A TaxID=3127639 RepID=UPI003757E366